MNQTLRIIVQDEVRTRFEALSRVFSREMRRDVVLHLEDRRCRDEALRTSAIDVLILTEDAGSSKFVAELEELRRNFPLLVIVLRLGETDLAFASAARRAGVDEVLGSRAEDDDIVVRELQELVRRRRGLGGTSLKELSFIRFTLDQAADAALWMREDGHLCYVNDAACRSLGYAKDELMSLTIFDIAPSLNTEVWEQHWQRLMRQGSFSLEYDYRRRNGEIYPVELSVNYVVFEGQAYNCTFARDISRRRRLEERLRQAEKLEAIGQLAGGVAHDFNNLLMVIMGQTELMLMEEGLDPSLRLNLNEVALASRHAATLTNQLLAFGRRQPRQARLIEPSVVIRELKPALDRLVPEPCRLELDIQGNLPRLIADPGQLEQILLNLTLNARDAMPEGGPIEIVLRSVTLAGSDARRMEVEPGLYLELRVNDEGRGIEEETKRRIFEPFFTTKPTGTGLGLSTVYGIVMQSRGAIRVENRAAPGSSFVVLLPAHQDQAIGLQSRS